MEGSSQHGRPLASSQGSEADEEVERLARYILRPPISLERVQWSGNGEVLYRPKGGRDGRARQPGDSAEAFDPAEFLARVITHIPEPRRHLVRYYGAYSSVSRGKRRLREEAACPSGEGHAPSIRAKEVQGPDARALRRSWAQLIKKIYRSAGVSVLRWRDEGHRLHHRPRGGGLILRHLRRMDDARGRDPPQETGLSAVS